MPASSQTPIYTDYVDVHANSKLRACTALMALLALVFAALPCAFAVQAAPSQQTALAMAGADCQTCCTKAGLETSAVCCTVHPQPAIRSSVVQAATTMSVTKVLPAIQWVVFVPRPQSLTATSPSPPLHPILRI